MALQTEIYLSGKLNNLVFYTSGGQKLVRTRPSNVKQSVNMQVRSRNFGIAAAAGRVMRSLLEPMLPFPKDRGMQILFSGAISCWLGLSDIASLPPQQPLEALAGFSFNRQVAFTDRCKIPFVINSNHLNELQVTLPAFNCATVFAAPAGTQQVEIIFSLAACALQGATNGNGHTQKLVFPFNVQLQPAQTLVLPAAIQRGSLLLLGAAARFIKEQGKADSRPAYLPAGIIWAAYY